MSPGQAEGYCRSCWGSVAPLRTKGARSCSSAKMQRPFWSPPTCPCILPPMLATRPCTRGAGFARNICKVDSLGKLREPRDRAFAPRRLYAREQPGQCRAAKQALPQADPQLAVTDESLLCEQLPSKSSITRKEQLKSTRAHKQPSNTRRDSGDTAEDPWPPLPLG